jgi:hypothetical protein
MKTSSLCGIPFDQKLYLVGRMRHTALLAAPYQNFRYGSKAGMAFLQTNQQRQAHFFDERSEPVVSLFRSVQSANHGPASAIAHHIRLYDERGAILFPNG